MFSGSRSGVRCAHRAQGLQHYGGLAGTVWQALIKSSASPRRVVSAETTGRNEMTPASIRPRGNLGDVLTAGPSVSRYVMSENVEKGDNLDPLKRRFSSLSTRYSHITYEAARERERRSTEFLLFSSRWNCSVYLICDNSFSSAYSLARQRLVVATRGCRRPFLRFYGEKSHFPLFFAKCHPWHETCYELMTSLLPVVTPGRRPLSRRALCNVGQSSRVPCAQLTRKLRDCATCRF